jgi:hypothetical protein
MGPDLDGCRARCLGSVPPRRVFCSNQKEHSPSLCATSEQCGLTVNQEHVLFVICGRRQRATALELGTGSRKYIRDMAT